MPATHFAIVDIAIVVFIDIDHPAIVPGGVTGRDGFRGIIGGTQYDYARQVDRLVAGKTQCGLELPGLVDHQRATGTDIGYGDGHDDGQNSNGD